MTSFPSFVCSPFRLRTADGSIIHGDIDTLASGARGRCILLPAFGISKLDLLACSHYLLCNGYDVVRFDPTRHVGQSDGAIADFTLSRLAADIGDVLSAHGREDSCVVSVSLSSRAALRALSGHRLRGLFFMSPVVHTRQTLLKVCREDLIGMHLDDSLPDQYRILGFDMNRGFCTDCIEHRFSDLPAALVDAARIDTPTSFIVGSRDRWVDIDEVRAVAHQMPSARTVCVDGGNHQMFRSPVMFQMYMSALLREMLSMYGVTAPPHLPQYSEVVQFVDRFKAMPAEAPTPRLTEQEMVMQ